MDNFFQDIITAINESLNEPDMDMFDDKCPVTHHCNQIIEYFNNNDVPEEVYNKVEEILDKVLLVLGLDDEDSEDDVDPDSENLDI